MTPKVLRAHIRPLDPKTPRHRALEQSIGVGAGLGNAWYRTQKEHWLGWLKEYDGPGAYGRAEDTPRNGAYIWNHIQCAPMLFWLAEALELPDATLSKAFEAVCTAPPRGASQCGALRSHIPWTNIEAALAIWPYSASQKARIWLAKRKDSGAR